MLTETGQLSFSHGREGLLRGEESGCFLWDRWEGAKDKQKGIAHLKTRKEQKDLAGGCHWGFRDQIAQDLCRLVYPVLLREAGIFSSIPLE